MAGAWRALVLVVGLAAVACVAQRSLSYEEIVNHALRFFNYGRRGQRLFGLLEAIPPPLTLEERNCTGNYFRLRHVRLLSVDCPQDSEREREREPGPAVQVPGVRRPAEVPEEATLESDSYKLPPVVRDQ
ncbi:Neutrophilic granule protein [Camelus dromedarius]|uniref:Neutrophilic granule protein n=1 Tax=Camelus dromedarius TaxID=9838 RepID=A0A5N4CZF5_CAMDR|nr:Neutrophilic granule protein [Camelus dromedarius]